MIKVLIVTYYWPPAGGPGVQRWLKFSKYLPEYDILPTVLSVDPNCATYPVWDESLVKEIPETLQVYRTKTHEFFGAYKTATKRKEVPYSGFASESRQPGFMERAARFIRGNFFYPDPRKSWKRYALPKAIEIIKKESIDIVISTGPPHSVHLIGLALKESLGVKWLADFRDPWTDIYYYRDFYPTTLVRKLERKMEKRVLNSADEITAASQGFKKLLSANAESAENITVITNGYDEDDIISGHREKDKSGEIQITYTGTLTALYPLKTFVSSILKLAPDIQKRIVINIAGKVDNTSEELLNKKDLLARVRLLGYIPHSEVMNLLRESDFVLLLIPELQGNEGIIPAKLFEYIGAGREIIGVGPKNCDAARIVNENSFGHFFEMGQQQKLQTWLSGKINDRGKGTAETSNEERRKLFSRRNLTRKLAEVIKAM